MAIEVICNCGSILRAPDQLAGKKARCPQCTEIMDVPLESVEIPVLEEIGRVDSRMTPEALFEEVRQTVVGVSVGQSCGSGFFLTDDGLIVTNRHVIGINGDVTIQLNSGEKHSGKVLQSFPKEDLAFVKVDLKSPDVAPIASADSVKVGQSVFAIGYPRGLSNTFTAGIISAINRELENKTFVQTDAPINPGNSGGPLFNEFGQAVGVNTMIMTASPGLGFAIPVDKIQQYFQPLRQNLDSIVKQTYCGICGLTSDGDKHCGHCGASYPKPAAPVAETATTAPTPQAATDDAGPTNCTACKKSVEGAGSYCPHCGTRLP